MLILNNYTALICFISLAGTMIGAFLGIIIKKPSAKFLSVIMGSAGGIMLSIVALDLIPEALGLINLINFFIYFLSGMVIVIIINKFIIVENKNIDNYKRIAILVILALGIHNFPEGIIIGCGVGIGSSFGIKMSIVIAMHDIPEGIAAAAPFMASGEKVSKILIYSFISALPTLLGAFLGIKLGIISNYLLGALFAFVSGIMSSIICGEMIPEAFELYDRISAFEGVLIGIIIGIFIIKIL